MSEFSGEGFKPFPNTHSDAQEVSRVSEWTQEQLEYKTNEYGKFMQRDDLMPRAIKTGNFVLDRLLFESAYRDGIYEPVIEKIEDSLCEAV